MSDELALLGATAQAELVRQRKASPRELVDAAIARIERVNPKLNAVIIQRFEKARAEAAAPDLPAGPSAPQRRAGSWGHAHPPCASSRNSCGPRCWTRSARPVARDAAGRIRPAPPDRDQLDQRRPPLAPAGRLETALYRITQGALTTTGTGLVGIRERVRARGGQFVLHGERG